MSKKAKKRKKSRTLKKTPAKGNKPSAKVFTVKQQRFIDCYAGDIKEAAKKAQVSYGYARNLMTKCDILKTIKNRQETEVRPRTIATRQRRQEFWTEVMEDTKRDMRDRLKASELLGKSEADFTENLSHRYPEGCGVMLVSEPVDAKEWQKLSKKHHRNINGNSSRSKK